jgi:hypothetical protein
MRNSYGVRGKNLCRVATGADPRSTTDGPLQTRQDHSTGGSTSAENKADV